MIYVTGDLHGEIERFDEKEFKKLKKNDTLIVCGDFGFVWDGGAREEKLLKKLSKKKYNILFVEGCHDNLARLSQMPTEEWNGGKVHRIADNIFHLIRGNVFNIEGKSFFAFGGTRSSSIDIDTMAADWWELELPTPEEMQQGKAALDAVGGTVDFIITHDCAAKLKSLITMDKDSINHLNVYLEDIANSYKFGRWFFGCHHMDKQVLQNVTGVYQQLHCIV